MNMLVLLLKGEQNVSTATDEREICLLLTASGVSSIHRPAGQQGSYESLKEFQKIPTGEKKKKNLIFLLFVVDNTNFTITLTFLHETMLTICRVPC